MRGRTAKRMSLAAVICMTLVAWLIFRTGKDVADKERPMAEENLAAKRKNRPKRLEPTPVATNRPPEVLDGFRGDVHPLLHGRTKLQVTAYWAPFEPSEGRDDLRRHVPQKVYRLFRNLKPAERRHTYTERDFSAFLPEKVESVGQTWALDLDRVAGFLKQFHPTPSLKLASEGRRAGPNGAFAVLRAMSKTHLDILFRVHAEFVLAPQVWYTPAYFSGRMLVDRKAGTVTSFRMRLPTDQLLNVHLTVGDFDVTLHEIVRVNRMELTGGTNGADEDIAWEKTIEVADADHALKSVFYKFMEIDWLPIDQVLSAASKTNKPILVIVSWGAWDDQSC